MKKNIIIFIILCITLILQSFSAIASEIKWYSYKEGKPIAQKEEKKVFLHFYANWCGYCKKMNKETFTNSKLIDYLNDNFISIRVNSDKQKKLARNFRVRGLPSNFFVSYNSGEQEIIGNRPGFIPSKDLLLILEYLYTDSYKKISFTKYLNQKNK